MRRDARVAGWKVEPGSGGADSLGACLAALVVDGVDGVVIGVGPDVDPGLARLAALAAGVPADVPIQVCAGADAGHAALQTAVLGVLSGYHRRVLVGGLGAVEAAWPPVGRTPDLDWRLSHLDALEQAGNRLSQHPVDAAEWMARQGGDPAGDLLEAEPRSPAAVALRISCDEDGPRIASLAGGGADPATSGRAVERAASRALHHVQLGLEEIDLAVICQDLPGAQAATATALGLPFSRVLEAPTVVPSVRALAAVPLLLEGLGAVDGRHAFLLSGGPDGLGRATLFDTARFA